MAAVDDNIGKLFQALTDLGQLDDTVMMFSSDHGFFLGEWRMYDKRFMHEPSIRTPMLVRYPRLVQPRLDARQMVLNTDIAPTFLELAGAARFPRSHAGPKPGSYAAREKKPKSWRKDWLYEYLRVPGAAQCPAESWRADRTIQADPLL